MGNYANNSLKICFYKKRIRIKIILLIEFFQTVVLRFVPNVFFGSYGAQTKFFGAKLVFSILDSKYTENFTFEYVISKFKIRGIHIWKKSAGDNCMFLETKGEKSISRVVL